jgi:cytosine/adenosine deaminase-related metal-dependent hydrolase
MFRSKQGKVLNLFEKLGFTFDHFNSSGKTSIYYALEHLDSRHRHLFVHNTLTQPEDVVAAHEWNNQTYWVSCPNANLYIENRLPNYQMFLDLNARVCLGTDSLTSNWQLSILEEIKTIVRYQSFIPLEELIRWATLNGAEALGIADRFGSIVEGKTPGLNLISVNDQGNLDLDSTVKKLC